MDKMIIGIHGLSNKPRETKLEKYWHRSLVEGQTNLGNNGDVPFTSVYWAKFLYKTPLHEDETFHFDSLFNDEPYVRADPGELREYEDSLKDDARALVLGLFGSSVDVLKRNFGMNALADWVLEKWLKDLAFYYDEDKRIPDQNGTLAPASRVLKDELKTAIRANRDREIMLISHSMGSVIAYDALRDLGRSEEPADAGIEVAHFITIGSPLGLPHVRNEIIEAREYDGEDRPGRVRTPTIVSKSWHNYADPLDPVAADVHLRNDYRRNASGVRVVDDLVDNDYRAPEWPHDKERKRNRHKSYGYLRTPELSKQVKKFLQS